MTTASLDVHALARAVHGSLRKKDVTEGDVLAVLQSLDLKDSATVLDGVAPRLRIRRLRFRGTKVTTNASTPIDYDQTFVDGVNVLLIERNTAGKSTILKTILFALSGDRSAYDQDVKNWIERVWLTLAIENAEFTVVIECGEHIRGVMVLGCTDASVESLVASGEFVFAAKTQDELAQCLQAFFFQRLGLTELRWVTTQQGGGVSEGRTSWRTYMQPLHFDADALEYLLCDPKHAIGNQQGLIFSAYLGLNFAQALNQLGVEKSTKTRESKLTEEEATRLRVQLDEDEAELASCRKLVGELDDGIRARQKPLREASRTHELVLSHRSISERYAELRALVEQRDLTGIALRRTRARKLRLEEALSMGLHLSGIDVTLCPNCEHDVAPEAIAREKETHHCRLCGTESEGADEAHVAQLEAEHLANAKELSVHLEAHETLGQQVAMVKTAIDVAESKSAQLQRGTADAVNSALPTDDENNRREALFEKIGTLRASIAGAQRRLANATTDVNALELRAYLVDRVRRALVDEASTRNAGRLGRLAKYIEDFARAIGTESISDVTCSALGVVQLRKHGIAVQFTGIKNPGERLRVKISFFLALAELGREQQGARHPGLLLVDQPGTSEMVDSDFANFAEILHRVDSERADRLQILCFTARPELRAATAAEKVYGPQNGDCAF